MVGSPAAGGPTVHPFFRTLRPPVRAPGASRNPTASRGASSYGLIVAIELVVFAMVVFGLLARMHGGESTLTPEKPPDEARDTTRRAPEAGAAAPASAEGGTRRRDDAPAGSPLPPNGHAAATGPAPIPPDATAAGTPHVHTAAPGTEAQEVVAPDGTEHGTLVPLPPDAVALPQRDASSRGATRDEAVTTIARLCVVIEVRKTVDGWYPESSGRVDDVHRGVETLCAALPPSVRARFDTADVDGDGRPELIDPWGRPFVYWRADDYGADQQIDTARSVHPALAGGGSPAAARRFQLISRGANGRYEGGAGDDVTSWER